MMESNRQKKVSRLIQKDLSEIFLQDSKTYYNGTMITITHVFITKDLSLVKVYLSLFPQNINVFQDIKLRGSQIKHQLSYKLKNQLRKTPDLSFYIDNSLEHYENIMKSLEQEHKEGIVKIKLPERFLQDENGRPIILTPDILQDIQRKASGGKKKQKIESDESSESSEEEEDDDDEDLDVPKSSNHTMDNEVPNTEEFVEEKDLKQQDLTNDEMDQIRQQLEMMNKSNNIVASNS